MHVLYTTKMNTLKSLIIVAFTCSLLLACNIHPTFSDSPIEPLKPPTGRHFVSSKSIEVIEDDTRYALTNNWGLFITKTLASAHTEFIGKTTTQGGWSIRRQDFSMQILSVTKETNCKICSKEYQDVYIPTERAC